jgi:DNA replication and repair protein RecF
LIVSELVLRNFRNISECRFVPDPKLNFLVGENGQGKTSFIEALGFLATLRSFRGSKSEEVLKWSEISSELSCKLSGDTPDEKGWETHLKVVFDTPGIVGEQSRGKVSKIAFINGKPYKSSTSYLSQRFGSFELGFHAVIFNPSDHDLVRGDPSTRRHYLDRVIAAENVGFLKTISKYQRILTQRNAVLKTVSEPQRGSGTSASNMAHLVAGFTDQLVHLGAQLAATRLEWVLKLAERLNETVHQIAPHQPSLRLVYLSNWAPEIDNLSLNNKDLSPVNFTGHGHLPSVELLEQSFRKRLSQLEAAEWRSGHSLVGPHRDDWAFYLGGQPLRGHGSQGEVRSALLALKLCEIDLFRIETGHRPLFLLDDFSSELDKERRSFLLQYLSESDLQVFVTTTEDTSSLGKKFRVSNGFLVPA